jgi:hypothetical protein
VWRTQTGGSYGRIRNQPLLGKYTAMARRVVPFADAGSPLVFLALLPVAPAAKLAKIVWRLVRWCPRQLLALARELPLVLLGVLAYGIGQVRGAFAATGSLDDFGRGAGTAPPSVVENTSASQAASRRTSNSRSTMLRPAAPNRARSSASPTSESIADGARRRRRAGPRIRRRHPRPAR